MANKSWKKFIDNSKYYKEMLDFVDKEKGIAPTKDKVFRFMDVDLDKAKCVILGMDPYPSTYGNRIPVATGRSFEVANVIDFTDKYKQTSLAQILKTLCYIKFGKVMSIDEIRNTGFRLNMHKWFDDMEKEGVIFLNSALTNKINNPGSHIKIWKPFMDELIEFMSHKNLKWLIWGKDALDRVKDIIPKENIIYTCHPATRVNNTFVNDCCFKKVKGIRWI